MAAIAGCTENSALLLVTMKLNVCPLSSAGPAVMAVTQSATACAPAS